MCGICGIIHQDSGRVVDRALLERMMRSLHHRGPDEEGLHIDGPVGMGHKRLSIIDLATGQQPMFNEDKTCCIVFNGEIYNFHGLRDYLNKKGHQFRTKSDTETILHLYEEYGEHCLKHLRGMFAFAIWDGREDRLFLARDRVGKKPLYYAQTSEAFYFASEMKAILANADVKREMDYQALDDYITYQYVPPPRTIFKDVAKLPPAHYLILQRGHSQVYRYWDLRYEPKDEIPEEEACETTMAKLDEAVKIRLESEVPLGCFLSGGVDSSAVVAFMRRHVTGELKTFSIGFKEEDFNELPYAREIAEKFETKHEEMIVEPDAVGVLPKIAWHFDEPYGDISALPTYYVSMMTRRYVTVALNGDGGDESFAGYERYRGFSYFRRYRKIPAFIRQFILQPPITSLFKALPQSTFLEKAYYINSASLLDEAFLYLQHLIIFREYMKPYLYSGDLKKEIRGHRPLDYFLGYFNDGLAREVIDKKMRSDILTYLPGDLLPKVDRTSMAHGLEARSPFLDHELMEYAARLPVSVKFRENVLKYHLKVAFKNTLPAEILHRPKMGFGVPVKNWFSGKLNGYLREMVLGEKARSRGWFDLKYIQKVIRDHETGRQNHHHRLWILLMLELWARTFLDRSDVSTGPLND